MLQVALGWHILPTRIKNSLGRIFVVHSGMWFPMAAKRLLPNDVSAANQIFTCKLTYCCRTQLVQKMVFCDSIDDTYQQLGSKTIVFPEFLFTHEGLCKNMSNQSMRMLLMGGWCTGSAGPAREIFAVASSEKWHRSMNALAAKVSSLEHNIQPCGKLTIVCVHNIAVFNICFC